MEPSTIISLASVLLTVVGLIGSWFANDAKGRQRLQYVEERLTGAETERATALARIAAVDVSLARSQGDRDELHRQVERLELTKASREVVDGIRQEIHTFRGDMDKRFDRLEQLVLAGRNGNGK